MQAPGSELFLSHRSVVYLSVDVRLPFQRTLICSEPVVPLWASLSRSLVLAAAVAFVLLLTVLFMCSALDSTQGLGRVALSTAQMGVGHLRASCHHGPGPNSQSSAEHTPFQG